MKTENRSLFDRALGLIGIQRRSSIREPITWNELASIIGGEPTYSGTSVTPQSALRATAVMACIGVISDTLSCLPIGLYQEMPDGSRRRLKEDPRDSLMARMPQPGVVTKTWLQTAQAHILSWGNAYAKKNFDGSGNWSSLEILLPDRTTARYVDNIEFPGVYYFTRDRKGDQKVLLPDEVLHVPGLGFDGVVGYSPIEMARQAIGAGLAAEEWSARFFGDGAKHDLVVSVPGALSNEARERFRLAIDQRTRGMKRNTLVLEEGAKAERISIPPNEAQFLETQKWNTEQVARTFRVPLHKIQDTSNTQPRANMEQENQSFIDSTMLSWTILWEQKLDQALLSSEELANGYYFKFNMKGLLRGDTAARYTAYSFARQWGLRTANEIRITEDEPPLPPEVGDTVLIPLNFIPISVTPGAEPVEQQAARFMRSVYPGGIEVRANGTVAALPVKEERTREAPEENARARREERAMRSAKARQRLARSYVKIFEQAIGRMVRVEVKFLRRVISKAFESDSPVESLTKELEGFYPGFSERFKQEIAAPIAVLSEGIAAELADEGYAPNGISGRLEVRNAERVDMWSTHHVESSQGQLRHLLEVTDAEELQRELSARVDDWEESRPGKDAELTSTTEGNSLSRFIYAAAGVAFVRWSTAGKNCPLCDRMDGRSAKVEGTFADAGDTIDPTDTNTTPLQLNRALPHPPLHGGCDCVIIPD